MESCSNPIVKSEGKPDAFMLSVLSWNIRYFLDPKAEIRLGNGARVPARVVWDLSRCLSSRQVRINWTSGDIALIDNRWVMHGRRPYLDKGRRILARFGLFEPLNSEPRVNGA